MRSNNHQAMLLVIKGSDTAIVARLDNSSILIGREAPAELIIDNHFVSRRHALITPLSDGYSISDQGSKNGTLVNKKPIGVEPVLLEDGDVIAIANGEVEIRYQISSGTATMRSIPSDHADSTIRGTLNVDRDTRVVSVGGTSLEAPLMGRQFSLLACLFEAAGRACSWNDLNKAGWPDRNPAMVSRNEVVQAVHEIRKRLSNAGSTAEIASVRGFGYRLDS